MIRPVPAGDGAASQRSVIIVEITDAETGETQEQRVTFEEGEGAGDDPTEEGRRGRTLVRVGFCPPAVFPMDPSGRLRPSIPVNRIECGAEYLISLELDTPQGRNDCGGPAAMAAQFEQVKDTVLARAVEVVKECWKHPSCQAVIKFQGSHRYCYRHKEGRWHLVTCYEVRVDCFKL